MLSTVTANKVKVLLLACLAFLRFLFLVKAQNENVALTVLVDIRSEVDTNVGVKRTYELLQDEDVDESVLRFCKEHAVSSYQCIALLREIKNRLQQGFYLGNSFPRIPDAFYNEVGNQIDPDFEFHTIEDTFAHVSRVAIIHSCQFQEQKFNVLEDLLNVMMESGLLSVIDKVWILNYGQDRGITIQHNAISYIHVANSCNNFENPSIKTLSTLSQMLDRNAQILYMHTKGASYMNIPQSVHDWRSYMLYFLVDKHEAVFHLLASGEFDVVGTNLRRMPGGEPIMMGNFWWSTAGHVQSLPAFRSEDKYSAELFILSSKKARVYVMHEVYDITIGEDEYGRERYNESDPHCIQTHVCVE